MIGSLTAGVAYQAGSQLKPQEAKKETQVAQTTTQKSASSDKAALIAEQIKNGTYEIDISKTAAAIAEAIS